MMTGYLFAAPSTTITPKLASVRPQRARGSSPSLYPKIVRRRAWNDAILLFARALELSDVTGIGTSTYILYTVATVRTE